MLAVDDHPVNREFLRVGLAGVVGLLDLVDSGPAAIQRCQERTYHVILMDLHMPQMDGLATANRIRDLEGSSADARMVLLTADMRPEEQARMLNNGFELCLTKPLSIGQLVSSLEQLIGSGLRSAAGQPPQSPRLAGSKPLIDHEGILATAHGDPAMVRKLGLMLSQELEEKLPLMEQLMMAGRHREVEDLLHQWAGASGFAGAARLGWVCSKLRQRLLDPVPSSIGSIYVDFIRIARATSEGLRGPSPERDSA